MPFMTLHTPVLPAFLPNLTALFYFISSRKSILELYTSFLPPSVSSLFLSHPFWERMIRTVCLFRTWWIITLQASSSHSWFCWPHTCRINPRTAFYKWWVCNTNDRDHAGNSKHFCFSKVLKCSAIHGKNPLWAINNCSKTPFLTQEILNTC